MVFHVLLDTSPDATVVQRGHSGLVNPRTLITLLSFPTVDGKITWDSGINQLLLT